MKQKEQTKRWTLNQNPDKRQKGTVKSILGIIEKDIIEKDIIEFLPSPEAPLLTCPLNKTISCNRIKPYYGDASPTVDSSRLASANVG